MFGQVVSGMNVVQEIAKVPTDIHDMPRIPVTVFDCGELDSNTGQAKKQGENLTAMAKVSVYDNALQKHVDNHSDSDLDLEASSKH